MQTQRREKMIKQTNNLDYITISKKGVTDSMGKQATHYKGNELASLNDANQKFISCVESIAQNYTINGMKVEIQSIKAITASNEAVIRNTLTKIKPVSKDTKSTKESQDKFIWFQITAIVGDTQVCTSDWLCWCGHGYASFASKYIVETFLNGLSQKGGNNVKEIINVLQPIYRAKSAQLLQSYQQSYQRSA
jgi:hypothetical protein